MLRDRRSRKQIHRRIHHRLGDGFYWLGVFGVVLLVSCGGQKNVPIRAAASPLQINPLAGCSQCHVDVEDEVIGTAHFQKRIGCKTCHGPSKGHLADENNEVKPDRLFTRADVNQLCEPCHECNRARQPAEATKKGKQLEACTDCHGHHDPRLRQGRSGAG